MEAFQSSTNSPTNLTITPSSGEIAPDDEETVLEAIPVNTHGLDGGWFGKILTTTILLFGTFGNAMTVIILRRLRSGWSAMNVYLTALALSDTVMLYSGTLPIWTIKVLAYDVYASHVVVCKLGTWLFVTSAALSSWLLVALTAQRAASVVWPHRVNVICTRHKSIVIIIVITAMCTVPYSGHIMFGFVVVTSENGTSKRCTFASADYQDFWVNVFAIVTMLVYSGVPCVCLLLSNAVLGWKLSVAMKDAKEKFSTGRRDQKDSRRKKVSAVSVTIITVSAVFVLVSFPFTLYNAFFRGLYASDDSHTRDIHVFLFDFFFVFGLSNFAWNFYLYCLTGSKFRGEFKKIMFGCCVPVPSATMSVYVTEESQVSEVGTRGQRKDDMESNDDF